MAGSGVVCVSLTCGCALSVFDRLLERGQAAPLLLPTFCGWLGLRVGLHAWRGMQVHLHLTALVWGQDLWQATSWCGCVIPCCPGSSSNACMRLLVLHSPYTCWCVQLCTTRGVGLCPVWLPCSCCCAAALGCFVALQCCTISNCVVDWVASCLCRVAEALYITAVGMGALLAPVLPVTLPHCGRPRRGAVWCSPRHAHARTPPSCVAAVPHCV